MQFLSISSDEKKKLPKNEDPQQHKKTNNPLKKFEKPDVSDDAKLTPNERIVKHFIFDVNKTLRERIYALNIKELTPINCIFLNFLSIVINKYFRTLIIINVYFFG